MNNILILENFCTVEDIDILLLCETWLTNTNYANINNGGVSIYIKNKYTCKTKIISDIEPIEAIECETTNLTSNIKIISIYIPPNLPSEITKNKFKDLLNRYNSCTNIIIAGDVNAHHNMWNSNSRQDIRGKIIAEQISDSEFILLNNGDYTYEKIINGKI